MANASRSIRKLATRKRGVYPVKRKALLWEALFFDKWRTPVRQAALWEAFEQVVLETAEVTELVTSGWEPEIPQTVFEAFLNERGYEPVEASRMWRRTVQRLVAGQNF